MLLRLICVLLFAGRLWSADPPPGAYDEYARRVAESVTDFPGGKRMSELGREAVAAVRPEVLKSGRADEVLLAYVEAEFAVFRAVEEKVCRAAVGQHFGSVDEFLTVAESITNRRKSRAGHSLEAQVEFLFAQAGIAFEAQAVIDGKVRPDMLLPSREAYNDASHPAEELVVLGLKTTCKDRWRQVLNEGKRVKRKHLLTLQAEMSRAQLEEMKEAGLQLVVPAALHAGYDVPEGYRVLSVSEFMEDMKRRFPAAPQKPEAPKKTGKGRRKSVTGGGDAGSEASR